MLLVLSFVGFQQFFLHGKAFPDRPLTPPIQTVLIAHGVAMSAWIILLVVQPVLIANSKYRVHMTLGKIGAVLAACLFVLGFKLGIEATRVSLPEVRLWNLPYRQFMAVPVISITIFAGFVAVGVWNRTKPEIHKPMMLLATLAAIPAALDRIEPLHNSYLHTIWGTIFGPFFSTLVVGASFFVAKWALTGKFDRCFASGWAFLVVAGAGIMKLATTQTWDGIAGFLLRF